MDGADWCVLDIETAGGVFGRKLQGFQLLVTGILWQGKCTFYTSEAGSLRALDGMLSAFPGTLVTFNGARFDLPILDEHAATALGRPLQYPRHYDLLQQIYRVTGTRISLQALALANLGHTKDDWDHSRNAQVWRDAPELLMDHNRADLELTAALYELVARQKPLKIGRQTVLLPTAQQ